MGFECTLSIGRRAGVASAAVFCSICCFAILVYSFFQITSQESAAGEKINCDKSPFSSNRPVAFYVGSKSDGEYIECPWDGLNSWLRILVYLSMSVLPFVPLYFGFVQKRKWVVWATGTMCATFSVICFVLMVLDANDVRKSGEWCGKGAKGSVFEGSDIKCDMWPFIFMCMAESVPILLWLVLMIGLFFYANKYMEDDFTDWDLDYQDAEHEGLLDKYSN